MCYLQIIQFNFMKSNKLFSLSKKNVLSIFLTVLTLSSSATVKLHALFSDNMVMQRGVDIPIYGTADANDVINIQFNGITKNATVVNGKWKVIFPAMNAGGGALTLNLTGTTTATISNILIGDVWMCSGQSNMGLPLIQEKNWATTQAQTANTNIRYLKDVLMGDTIPQYDMVSSTYSPWKVDNSANRQWISAVAYYCLQGIYNSEQVPLGLIDTSIGGTGVIQWTPLGDLQSDPSWQWFVSGFNTKKANYNANKAAYLAKVATDTTPAVTDHYGWFATGQYNSLISPLTNSPLKGVLWYQGEADAYNPGIYKTLFPIMINSWRREFDNPTLPFIFVQLPNYIAPANNDWAGIRQVQQTVRNTISNTGMAVIIDLGDSLNIHPTNKMPVGDRLSKIALNIVYGKNIDASAPVFSSAVKSGNSITVSFADAQKGLMSKDGAALREFEVAGADSVYKPAVSVINGQTITVTCSTVLLPAAIRYAWKNNPNVNLFGSNGFPVAPFKSKIYTNIGTGMNNIKNTELNLYPNPVTSGSVNINGIMPSKPIEIWNSEAKLMKKYTSESSSVIISVSDLNKGIYLVKSTTDKRIAGISKLIIE